jgi:iron complex outermembrane receptor protein
VEIDDRIVVTENLTASRDAAGNPSGANPGRAIATILNNAGFRVTNAARFFINGLDTRTRGIDVVATYRHNLGDLGRLNLTGGFNYNKTKLERILAAPGPLASVPGVVLFGRQESLRLVQGQPRTKINLSADYEMGAFGVTVRGNRFGRVLGAGGELGPVGSGIFNDVEMRPTWITDLELRLDVRDQFEFALGANNVFDEYPDLVPTGVAGRFNNANVNFPATSYVTPYSAFSPFGFNGRFLYARAAVKF